MVQYCEHCVKRIKWAGGRGGERNGGMMLQRKVDVSWMHGLILALKQNKCTKLNGEGILQI